MDRPIGVFDSGVGGLTVVKEIIKKLPNETVYFYGDTFNCPFGQKNKEEIIKYTEIAIQFLIKKNVKLIVLACNTATAAALDYLQKKFNIPILGVVNAGVKIALKKTKNKNILLLATSFTVNSKIYDEKFLNEDKEVKIISKSCPSFVPFIESGYYFDEKKSLKIVSDELINIDSKDIDTVVLGCTHYPILSNKISEYFKDSINVVSPSSEIVFEIYNLLKDKKLLSNLKRNKDKLFITKYSNEFKTTAENLLYKNIIIEII